MKAATDMIEEYDAADGISIHAAREGGDGSSRRLSSFLTISIHAAREGGDVFVVCSVNSCPNFNPRRP